MKANVFKKIEKRLQKVFKWGRWTFSKIIRAPWKEGIFGNEVDKESIDFFLGIRASNKFSGGLLRWPKKMTESDL